MSNEKLKLIECPRDAMQGIHDFIPTETKATYINHLLKVGFDTLDVGSFVSPKAIPQMRDTADLIPRLDLDNTNSKLSVIVANRRGARDAVAFDEVTYLGYPFSISETFQIRNTNATIEESLQRVADIQAIAIKNKKELLIYISMAFGNPYGDEWNVEIAQSYVEKLKSMGINRFSLSDTIGVSTPKSISYLFENLIPLFPEAHFNAHLHTTPDKWEEKVHAAYESGCRSFDGALKGYGGCPMAKDELTGNMPMEHMISYFDKNKIDTGLDMDAFGISMKGTDQVFH
ncbi:hydroxymethylglutaryl-CoA lyase [Saprospiraceae bacterium]|nr:hydroxymethylglutaryl-CoA lyase [Saprospiraceae bacterium]